LKLAASVLLVGTLALVVSAVAPAWSHPLDPSLLELWGSKDGSVEVLWRQPITQPLGAPLEPVFPDGCHTTSPRQESRNALSVSNRWRLNCAGRTLVGQSIGVKGLAARQTDALVRVHLADGRVIQSVLRGDSASFTVPGESTRLDVLRSYLSLGFEHIQTGPDHLLFLLGLILLVHGWWTLAETITAFTLGDSVTLSLAMLHFVHISPRLVEAIIAFTILMVAVELTHDVRGDGLGWGRMPWAMAFVFGLLHGVGFAGALSQVGLPAGEIPLALFSFNAGIELAQLSFVAAFIALVRSLGTLEISYPAWTRWIAPYAIGSWAAFWLIQRCMILV